MNGMPLRLRTYVFAWLAVFFGFAAVAHGNFETSDAAFTMHAAHVLWQRGDSGLRGTDQGGELPGEQTGAWWIHKHQAEGNPREGKVGTNDLAYPWFPMGHVWLLAPFTVLGDGLCEALPSVERAYRERVAPGVTDEGLLAAIPYLEGSPVLMQGPIALLVPPACIATIALLLYLLATALGATRRDALIGTFGIVLATQCFALGRETLSDGPGLVLFLAALLGTVRTCQGSATARTALLTGLAAGGAVLLRYQTGFVVVAFAVAIGIACARRRAWRDAILFVAGGAPALALLLLVNWLRFGDPFDTGYPPASDWLTEPVWVGAAKILFGAGRGVMWLSPLLWLALPLALRGAAVVRWRWLAWVLFLLPLLFFGCAQGWQGGRCWAVRYVTPAVVALLAIVLPQTAPWRRWPKAWVLLLAFGVFANITSVVAPVRGVIQLGAQAVAAVEPAGVDPADVLGWRPRYTPLLANWRYAAASFGGEFEDEQQRPRPDSRAVERVFGITARDASQAKAPDRWEDRAGRHLWWRFHADLLGLSSWALLLPVVLIAAAFAAAAVRAARRARAAGGPAPPSPFSTPA